MIERALPYTARATHAATNRWVVDGPNGPFLSETVPEHWARTIAVTLNALALTDAD